jgi:signal peptidase II
VASTSSDLISERPWAHRLDRFLAIVVGVVVVDQLVKGWARDVLVEGVRSTLVPGIMDLELVYNTGAAFSLGEGARWLFVAIAVCVVAACLVVVLKGEGMPTVIVASLGCVAGGGVGNLVDRVLYGRVTDFLATSFIDFPVFNVADIAVTCGVAVAFVAFLVWDRALSRRSADEGDGRG